MRRGTALALLFAALSFAAATAAAGPARATPSGTIAPAAAGSSAVAAAAVAVPISSLATSPASDSRMGPRVAFLEAARERVLMTDRLRWIVGSAWASCFLLALVFSAVAAWRGAPRGALRRWAGLALTVPLVVPAAGYVLAAVLVATPLSLPGAGLLLLAVALVFATLAVAAGWRWGARRAAAAVLALTAALVVADQLLGSPMLLANVFGYSLALGGRFYGLGNEGAGLLLAYTAAALVLVAPGRGDRRAGRFAIGAGLAFAGALAVCVAPWWGANTGVALWGGVLLLGTWRGLLPDSWPRRSVWIAALVVVAVTVVFVALDAVLGLTHSGRYVSDVMRQGWPAAQARIAERAGRAWETLSTSPWTLVLAGLLAGVVWLRWWPPASVSKLLADRPSVRALLASSFFAMLVAFVVEDTPGSIGAFLPPLALVAVLLWLLDDAGTGASRDAAVPSREAGPR